MSLSADGTRTGQTAAAWSIPDYLLELLQEEPTLVVDLVEMFLHDAANNLDRLRRQAGESDGEAAAMTLHALRGSSLQMGGLKVGLLAEEMEEDIHRRGVDAVRDALSDLEDAFRTLRSEMEYWIVGWTDRQRTN